MARFHIWRVNTIMSKNYPPIRDAFSSTRYFPLQNITTYSSLCRIQDIFFNNRTVGSKQCATFASYSCVYTLTNVFKPDVRTMTMVWICVMIIDMYVVMICVMLVYGKCMTPLRRQHKRVWEPTTATVENKITYPCCIQANAYITRL